MRWKFMLVPFVMAGLFLIQTAAVRAEKTEVRPSVLAGSWYEADADKLAARIRSYLDKAKPPDVPGRLVAVAVPHAGHIYSGQVAAYAFRMLKNMDSLTPPLMKWGRCCNRPISLFHFREGE